MATPLAASAVGTRNVIETALKRVRKQFMGVLTQPFPQESTEYDLVLYRAKRLFDQTVMGGKYGRGSLCFDAFSALSPSANDEQLSRFSDVAATLEMVQAVYLIADDIMDKSEMRRGKKCWYQNGDIGLSAVNDILMMDSVVEDVIHKAIPTNTNIAAITESFRRSKRATILGQLLDTSSQYNTRELNWERYERLVQHKTSHYTIFHPLEVALLSLDIRSSHPLVRQLAYKIGFLFQAQDDYLDVFGDPAITGKVGTDLRDGKCTWITVRTMHKMQQFKDEAKIQRFVDNFIKDGSDKNSAVIRQIVEDMQISNDFLAFEQKLSDMILDQIDSHLPSDLDPLGAVLTELVNSLRNRER